MTPAIVKTIDVAGASFYDGVTNVSAEHLVHAMELAGDRDDPPIVFHMHPRVVARLRGCNITDRDRGRETFMGRKVEVRARDTSYPQRPGVYITKVIGPTCTVHLHTREF